MCAFLHPVYLLIAIAVASFIVLRSQDYIVTHQIKSRDPRLFESIGGHGYDNDVMGMYGVVIIAKVFRALWNRKELIRHFKWQYYVYVVTTLFTLGLIILLFIVDGFIYQNICKWST